MPKKANRAPWGGRNNRPNNADEKHYFSGHDDRVVRMENALNISRPRVSFKTQTKPNRDKQRHLNLALKQQLDDDVSMTVNTNNNGRQIVMRGQGSSSRGRYSPLPQRIGKRGGGGSGVKFRPRPAPPGEMNWYKITIPYGHKYPKDFILSKLLSHLAPHTFIPIMYRVIEKDAIFYVDNSDDANKILNCDRKITATDGFKINVRIRPGYPQCEVDGTLKERLKLALGKRYVLETNALDLSKFHLDPDLAPDYFCALFRPALMMTVLEIVSEHIPSLEALNLDSNRLMSIDKLVVLKSKFSKLKILHIGDNRLKEMNQIDSIKDLQLEELRLAGNPMCNKYKTRQNEYVSDVRKRFPKLLRLDGIELPRPILFDVENETAKIPPTQILFAANPESKVIATQFLAEYFRIYDTNNRQDLLNAYHENTSFSMTISYLSNTSRVSTYITESRNLCRLSDSYKRRKLLKQGRLSVVTFISELPRTQHYENTFMMDICLVTKEMMLITVTGLFKELDGKEEPLRFFNRTFVIVPEGSGYCICNEQLHISQPTESQEKQMQIALTSPQITPVAGPSTAPIAVVSPSQEDMQRMALTLMQQTNMNLEWSAKCLEECHWNFENALSAFQDCLKRGQIPPEAFKS